MTTKQPAKRNQYGDGTIFQRNPDNPNSLTLILDVSTQKGQRKRKWYTYKREPRETDRQFHKRVEAERDKLIIQRREGVDLAPKRLTVAAFLERWLSEYVKPNLGARTYRAYEYVLRVHVLPAIGDKQLRELRPLDVQGVYTAMHRKGLSGTSALHAHRTLKEALGYAYRWELVSENVADKVTAPRATTPEARAATVEELGRILDASEDTPIAMLVRLTIWTGLRLGEALGLRWKDIEGDRLYVRQTLGNDHQFRPPKTRRSQRPVPLSATIVDALSEHRRQQVEQRLSVGPAYDAEADLVFADGLGKPINQFKVNYQWRQIAKAAGVQGLRFHDLRHSHASQLYAAGVPEHEIQARLGHSTPTTTRNIYGHFQESPESKAAGVMDKVLAQKKYPRLSVVRVWRDMPTSVRGNTICA